MFGRGTVDAASQFGRGVSNRPPPFEVNGHTGATLREFGPVIWLTIPGGCPSVMLYYAM
jgi:hypothetical protein